MDVKCVDVIVTIIVSKNRNLGKIIEICVSERKGDGTANLSEVNTFASRSLKTRRLVNLKPFIAFVIDSDHHSEHGNFGWTSAIS